MTFVGAVVSIVCMACYLCVRGTAHSGETGQARQSRHAASIDRRGSARVRRATAVEHRRARSPPALSRPLFGTSPPFRRGRGPPPARSEAEDRTRLAVGEELE